MSTFAALAFPLASEDHYDQAQTIATIASAFAYGIVIVLFLNCFHLLIKTKHVYSNKMRLALSAYMLAMFGMSTLAIVQAVLYNRRAIFCNVKGTFQTTATISQLDFSLNIPLLIPFTIWGADGFMLWRCLLLYQGLSKLPQLLLRLVLFCISLISLGSGIVFFLTKEISEPVLPPYTASKHPSLITSLQGPTSLTISVTPVVNLLFAGLIVGRLLYHQRHMRKVMGAQYGSPYRKIISMCTESCAMIIVNSVVYVGLYFGADNDGQNIEILTVLLIFPHICVISPFLIIYRVARGRTVTMLTTTKFDDPQRISVDIPDLELSIACRET